MFKLITRWTALVVVLLFLLGGLVQYHPDTPTLPLPRGSGSTGSITPGGKTRVIVGSCFVLHGDVYFPVVKNLQELLSYSQGRHYPDAVRVHAPPFSFGFQEVIDDLGLYNGHIYTWESLTHSMGNSLLHGISGEGYAQVLIFGTCVFDLNEYTKGLIEVWDARPADQKFMVVCIGHGTDRNDVDGWKRSLTQWVRRRSIRILTISEHITDSFQELFKSYADDPSNPDTFSAGYEYVQVDTHVPLLDLPDPVRRVSDADRIKRGLSQVMIQGSMESGRRDYAGVLGDLEKSLKEDPAAWGYLPLGTKTEESDDGSVYHPDPNSALDPFILNLAGRGGIDIPDSLQKNIIKIHKDLKYNDFYEVMHGMDLVLPAFAGDTYYDTRASSTFVMAVQCNVPLLVSNRTLSAYRYAASDATMIIRPQAMREIEAIKALRTGQWIPPSQRSQSDDTPPGAEFVEREMASRVKRMQDLGWVRSDKRFREVKNKVWQRNREVVQDILGLGREEKRHWFL